MQISIHIAMNTALFYKSVCNLPMLVFIYFIKSYKFYY